MNELLIVLEVILTFGAVVAAHRLFGKAGLITWTAIAMILANLTVVKLVPLAGLEASLGNVMFASTFLATDMIVEFYGKEDAKKSVWIGIAATVCFVVCTQIAILYQPSAIDAAQEPMQALFAFNLRSSVASILCCLAANLADVWLYEKIRNATNGKYVGLRSSVAAIVCNCTENFLFWLIAFGGIYAIADIVVLGLTSSAIELVLGLCNPPFLYLALRLQKRSFENGGEVARSLPLTE